MLRLLLLLCRRWRRQGGHGVRGHRIMGLRAMGAVVGGGGEGGGGGGGGGHSQHAEAVLVAVAEELRLGGQVVDAVEDEGGRVAEEPGGDRRVEERDARLYLRSGDKSRLSRARAAQCCAGTGGVAPVRQARSGAAGRAAPSPLVCPRPVGPRSRGG